MQINSDGQQFHRHQQNKPLHLIWT